jgi:hypothetical protein
VPTPRLEKKKNQQKKKKKKKKKSQPNISKRIDKFEPIDFHLINVHSVGTNNATNDNDKIIDGLFVCVKEPTLKKKKKKKKNDKSIAQK